MTEEPASAQRTESSADTPIPSTVEGAHHLGQSHQVSHSNSAQTPTEANLDAETLSSPNGEEHDIPTQSSRLVP